MNNIRTRKRGNDSFSRNRGSAQFSNRGNIRSKKKAISSIDPNRLIERAVTATPVVFTPSRLFEQMPLNGRLKSNLSKKGFTHPTQIQEDTFEYLTSGRDLVGIANTGTGKTGAFLIPIIEQLLNKSRTFQSLVVVPTRELALQVEADFKSLAHGLGLYGASFIGGTSVRNDLSHLKRQNHIIVGTPGRLIDLADRGALRLQEISILVLDEFDRMLDMGFVHDIKKITDSMAKRNQTMLFSATSDHTQKALISRLLTNPSEVKVGTGAPANGQIEQDIIKVPHGSDKFKMLLSLIDDSEFEKVLIFAETKRLVDRVNKKLNQSGVRADLIHGDKSQNYRNRALNKFKRGNVQVLVATDVAARGIDVANITHVISYQLPLNLEDYVHRIGRTGRAGKTGKAFTFVDEVN